jgi:rhodanese-related sulfurtransferase
MLELFKRHTGKVINVNDLDDLIGKIELIDIREPYEYQSGSLKTAKNIPMGNLLSQPEKYLNKTKTYYIMCQSGARSSRTCSVLSKQGFDVINVSGGMGFYIGAKRS